MVYRVYVEKKKELAHEAKALLGDARTLLGIKNLEDVRVINRYDAENITKDLFDYAVKTVFSEPQLDIASEEKKGYQQLISSLAISLIGRIHYEDINHTYGDTYIERIINQAKAVMKEDTTNNEPLENIAHSLGVSYSFFRREFKKRCGVSPGQYRLELRLIKAKELLLSTNLSIADISAKLHFECIGQFSTFFKKKSGTSPLEFRKQGIKKD